MKLHHLSCCLDHPYTAVRHMTARCFGMMSRVITSDTMTVVLRDVLPLLGATDCDRKRQGAIETLACILSVTDEMLPPLEPDDFWLFEWSSRCSIRRHRHSNPHRLNENSLTVHPIGIIDQLGFELVPYIVLLVVPVMGSMSDPNQFVRLMATSCFATLVRLMPLDGVSKESASLSKELLQRKMEERHFLDQLFDTKKLENYKVPVSIKAELRAYQQVGE